MKNRRTQILEPFEIAMRKMSNKFLQFIKQPKLKKEILSFYSKVWKCAENLSDDDDIFIKLFKHGYKGLEEEDDDRILYCMAVKRAYEIGNKLSKDEKTEILSKTKDTVDDIKRSKNRYFISEIKDKKMTTVRGWAYRKFGYSFIPGWFLYPILLDYLFLKDVKLEFNALKKSKSRDSEEFNFLNNVRFGVQVKEEVLIDFDESESSENDDDESESESSDDKFVFDDESDDESDLESEYKPIPKPRTRTGKKRKIEKISQLDFLKFDNHYKKQGSEENIRIKRRKLDEEIKLEKKKKEKKKIQEKKRINKDTKIFFSNMKSQFELHQIHTSRIEKNYKNTPLEKQFLNFGKSFNTLLENDESMRKDISNLDKELTNKEKVLIKEEENLNFLLLNNYKEPDYKKCFGCMKITKTGDFPKTFCCDDDYCFDCFCKKHKNGVCNNCKKNITKQNKCILFF